MSIQKLDRGVFLVELPEEPTEVLGELFRQVKRKMKYDVVLDLSALELRIASLGKVCQVLELLLEKGRNLVICRPSEGTKLIMKFMGYKSLFTVRSDVSAAFAYLGKQLPS